MAGYKFTVKLDIDNIGPHYGERKLAFADEVDSNKAIIFATNGTGKSFISRAFRLTSNEKRAELADDLLTLGQKFGNLSFSVINNDNVKQLSISLERGKIPVIKDSTGLVFHVFNSDYIEENIKQNHYTLDGNIQGYILGKAQIDLTEEREREKILEREHASSSETIDIEIEQARKQLREKRVLPTTTEFGLIEKNRLLGTEDFENIASFEEIVAQLDTLSKVPDVLPDVQAPSLNVDSTALYEAGALLTTEFPKTEWDEEFVTDIKANRTFIESGLVQLNDRNTCPFCKQPLQADALRLLKNYKAYLVDKEAETLRSIEACIKSIEDIIEDFEKVYSSTKVAIADIDGLKEYFPSLADVKLEISGVGEEATREFKSIIELLEEKSSDLDKVHPEIDVSLKMCLKWIKSAEEVIGRNTQVINRVNKTKQDCTGERLTLRRNLCKAQFLRLREKMKPLFDDYHSKDKDLNEIRINIDEKERKVRISKRDKVYEALTFFLNMFFKGKYCIDKNTFQMQFFGSNIGNKASSILSDGEKSIIAFCYFLASTHLLIEREDDYNNLFFVIDDPISSMDFHSVYAVIQCLKDIKEYFGITTHDRMWVFTHDMEFLSIISRNYIINNAYILNPGDIERWHHQLLLPYENHLKDIVYVAAGRQQPSHTTANSIRHVLETVCRFEYPDRKLEKYIEENSILLRDSCILPLCQDLSHGGIRNQLPFSPAALIAACQTVVDFMKTKYEGQVEAIPV